MYRLTMLAAVFLASAAVGQPEPATESLLQRDWRLSLVSRPPKIKGLKTFTVDTRYPRDKMDDPYLALAYADGPELQKVDQIRGIGPLVWDNSGRVLYAGRRVCLPLVNKIERRVPNPGAEDDRYIMSPTGKYLAAFQQFAQHGTQFDTMKVAFFDGTSGKLMPWLVDGYGTGRPKHAHGVDLDQRAYYFLPWLSNGGFVFNDTVWYPERGERGRPVQAAGLDGWNWYSPSGKLFARLHNKATVHIFSLQSGQPKRGTDLLEDQNGTIVRLSWSADEKFVATSFMLPANKGHVVSGWSLPEGKRLGRWVVSPNVESIALSPDGSRVLVAAAHLGAYLYTVGEKEPRVLAPYGSFTHLGVTGWSADGSECYATPIAEW